MNRLFLDVYFGQQIAESTANNSWMQMFSDMSTYIFVFITLILLLFLLTYLMPLILRNPKTYFNRYKRIREEMNRIDELYVKKELSFEEYAFAQFNYAKEYETTVVYLSKFPEYKSQLQSYKIKETEFREKEYKTINKADKNKIDTVDFLFDLLRSQAKYYTKGEIEQAILDEGFTRDIANLVVGKLEDIGTNFSSETKMQQSKVINIINSLLAKNYENAPTKGEASSVNLNDLSKKRKSVFEEEKVSFEKYPQAKKEIKKQSVLSSIKDLFKSKPKTHTVSEINDVFAEIEKRLKENK